MCPSLLCSGASYYEGSFSNISRDSNGDYVAVSSRGNFFMTWTPGAYSVCVCVVCLFVGGKGVLSSRSFKLGARWAGRALSIGALHPDSAAQAALQSRDTFSAHLL